MERKKENHKSTIKEISNSELSKKEKGLHFPTLVSKMTIEFQLSLIEGRIKVEDCFVLSHKAIFILENLIKSNLKSKGYVFIDNTVSMPDRIIKEYEENKKKKTMIFIGNLMSIFKRN